MEASVTCPAGEFMTMLHFHTRIREESEQVTILLLVVSSSKLQAPCYLKRYHSTLFSCVLLTAQYS